MIRLHALGKAYRVHGRMRAVLSGIEATFRPGEAVGILGRNGAGKTTLLRLIAGVEHPTSGWVERGMSVSWPLGFAGAMHYSITGADNARFIARIYGKPVAETVEFVDAFSELGDYYRMPARTYSSGMLTRLGFALSMAVDFDCYLVDEAVGAGDARFVDRTHQAMEERLSRSALLMVSHSPEQVRLFCRTAGVLRQGRLDFYEDVDEAIAAYQSL